MDSVNFVMGGAMQIDSVQASTGSLLAIQREQDKQVQVVFSNILESVGRKGYESVTSAPNEKSTAEDITCSWNDWFNSHQNRYQNLESPDELKESYTKLLVQAYDHGGYVSPKDFLKSLSKEELHSIQLVQHLAAPIEVSTLSEEGALNLLLPQAAQVDINKDGYTQSGKALTIRFPDSNTPPNVVAAWEEATADLSWGERATYELQMMLPLLTSNLHVDSNGAFSHVSQPGDSDFVNPFDNAEYSYVDATQQQLDYLEAFKEQIPKDKYMHQKSFWREFQERLSSQSVR